MPRAIACCLHVHAHPRVGRPREAASQRREPCRALAVLLARANGPRSLAFGAGFGSCQRCLQVPAGFCILVITLCMKDN